VSPALDALFDFCRQVWPLVMGGAFLWLCYRVESAEERLAHTRISLYTLIETLHDDRYSANMTTAHLRERFPELKLDSSPEWRENMARRERAS